MLVPAVGLVAARVGVVAAVPVVVVAWLVVGSVGQSAEVLVLQMRLRIVEGILQ